MGLKPAGERVFVEAFLYKYHTVLLLAFMLVKADKALLAKPVLHTMGTVVNNRGD
jgi:hypothetical protein